MNYNIDNESVYSKRSLTLHEMFLLSPKTAKIGNAYSVAQDTVEVIGLDPWSNLSSETVGGKLDKPFFEDNVVYLYDRKAINVLSKKYTVDDFNLVQNLLRIRPDLIDFLLSAYLPLKEIFIGAIEFRISYISASEEGETDRLYLKVTFKDTEPPKSIIKKYNNFLDKWWIKNSYEIEDSIVVGII